MDQKKYVLLAPIKDLVGVEGKIEMGVMLHLFSQFW